MTVPNRISIVTFGVADLARSTAFYESLGWTKSGSSMPTITFFDTVGPVFGLYEWSALADDAQVPSEGSGFRGVTLAMNLASTDDVDAVFAEWIAAGASSVVEPHTAFWGGYSSYVADPDGHLWEIAHNPYAGLDDDGRLVMGAS
ncbi:MAG TPA: VOC family protein [Ilumatobacteraceae bacterium]|nr:VOC family protein [Ilumatobacteraceae bacterium]